MLLADNSLNHLHVAGEEFYKPQLRELIEENEGTQLLEMSNMIDSIHQLSLTLRYSTKAAYKNINQLSLILQTIVDQTNKTQQRRSKLVEKAKKDRLEQRRQKSVEKSNLQGPNDTTKVKTGNKIVSGIWMDWDSKVKICKNQSF